MARDSFLLFGSRGKVGNLVSYKGEKSTVLRMRVIPANPRSIAQMQQRVVFGTAATAAKLLLPIIGQTFQGQPNEKLNRREFVRQNINAMVKAAGKIQGTTYDVFEYGFNPKGGNQAVVPNPWIISDGTLQHPAFQVLPTGTQGDDYVLDAYVTGEQTLPTGDLTAEDIAALVFGEYNAGLQITFVGIAGRDTDMVMVVENDPAEGLPMAGVDNLKSTVLLARRLVFKASDGSTLTVTSATTKQQVITQLLKCIDETKTSKVLYDAITDGTIINFGAYDAGAGGFEVNSSVDTELLFGIPDTNYTLLSTGCFSSLYSGKEWRYSRCVMDNVYSCGDVAAGAPDPTRWGFNLDNAILSYLGQSNVTTDLYTRRGMAEGNSIGSF